MLDRGDVVLGRTRECGLLIQGAGVTRRHCMLTRDGEHTDVEARYHAAVLRLMGTDALTQLKNRRFLEEQLEREIARSGRYERTLSIVLIDIDHSKHGNDTFGHPAGDAVLQQTGWILGRSMRREDCVGRFGGDEFLVLLPETKPLGAQLFAQRLCARFAGDAFSHEGKRFPVTISAGVAAWRPGMDGAQALLKSADNGSTPRSAPGATAPRWAIGGPSAPN